MIKNKKICLSLKQPISTIFLGFLFSVISIQSAYGQNATMPQLNREAIILLNEEKKLLDARLKEEWNIIHNLQHPDFRKKVSLEEIRYFEGWVTNDYRERAKQNAHISGSFVPTLDFIKKNTNKKDPLGYPVVRRYRWSDDPFLKIKSYSVEKIFISADGKYAKVKSMLKGRQRLNPALTRGGNYEFAAQYPLTDYWEKVGGDWVITLLSIPVNTSGRGVIKYYVPNNKSSWVKAEFLEINLKDLKLH